MGLTRTAGRAADTRPGSNRSPLSSPHLPLSPSPPCPSLPPGRALSAASAGADGGACLAGREETAQAGARRQARCTMASQATNKTRGHGKRQAPSCGRRRQEARLATRADEPMGGPGPPEDQRTVGQTRAEPVRKGPVRLGQKGHNRLGLPAWRAGNTRLAPPPIHAAVQVLSRGGTQADPERINGFAGQRLRQQLEWAKGWRRPRLTSNEAASAALLAADRTFRPSSISKWTRRALGDARQHQRKPRHISGWRSGSRPTHSPRTGGSSMLAAARP